MGNNGFSYYRYMPWCNSLCRINALYQGTKGKSYLLARQTARIQDVHLLRDIVILRVGCCKLLGFGVACGICYDRDKRFAKCVVT